jgi:pilus assembly protein CpaC
LILEKNVVLRHGGDSTGRQDPGCAVITEAEHMSSFPARIAGIAVFFLSCLALAPAGAEVVPQMRDGSGADHSPSRDATLAAEVEARLRHLMPGEAIEVRTANSGLVLSGQLSDPANLHRALRLAEDRAPGRVSNLMTVGRLPRIELTLQLAEMPRSVARNLSASMGLADLFAPSTRVTAAPDAGSLLGFPAGDMDVSGLLAALEAKGALRPLATAALTVPAGQVTHLPEGRGCAGPAGIGMDVTPALDAGGRISVTLRTCLAAAAPGTGGDSTVTILLQDGQTFAVADVLPDLLRVPGSYNAALASEPTLGPLLNSADYRAGRTEVMILITARIAGHGPVLSADMPQGSSEGTVILIGEPAAPGAGLEGFTLSSRLLD